MSKEPDSRKQPDEERDDILGDDIEEIDLDALLADDGLDTAVTGKAAPEPASGKSDEDAFLDSEVLDLGSGEEEVETLSADDLLELEDAPERSQSARMDSATNGNPEDEELSSLEETPGFPAREEMPRSTLGSSGTSEDVPDFNLLDDLPSTGEPEEKPIDLLADDFSLGDAPADAPEESSEVVEEETAVLAEQTIVAADESSADEAVAAFAGAAAAAAKKPGRARTKPLKGKKAKEAEAVTTEAPAKARSPKKKAKEKVVIAEKVAVASVRSTGSIPFVCSECYEEFLISSSYPHEMVSCPECLHVGKKPDADFIRTIHLHKAGEKRSLLAAVACGAILGVVALALVWMNAPGAGADKAPDGTTNMALFGLGALLIVCLLWLVARFEKNRWEVYF